MPSQGSQARSSRPGGKPARSPGSQIKSRRCRSCGATTSTGALIAGECPDCAGLLALPLRGTGGRFLSLSKPRATDTTTDTDGTSDAKDGEPR